MKNHFYHIRWPPLNATIFIMLVCNCVMGATLMGVLLRFSSNGEMFTWSPATMVPWRYKCLPQNVNNYECCLKYLKLVFEVTKIFKTEWPFTPNPHFVQDCKFTKQNDCWYFDSYHVLCLVVTGLIFIGLVSHVTLIPKEIQKSMEGLYEIDYWTQKDKNYSNVGKFREKRILHPGTTVCLVFTILGNMWWLGCFWTVSQRQTL